MIDPILRDAETKMTKSVDHFAAELATIRTGRANPALIDKIMVPYYGTPTQLNQLAQISAPEPRLLVVQVYDKSQMGAVEKALRTSEQAPPPSEHLESPPPAWPRRAFRRPPSLPRQRKCE